MPSPQLLHFAPEIPREVVAQRVGWLVLHPEVESVQRHWGHDGFAFTLAFLEPSGPPLAVLDEELRDVINRHAVDPPEDRPLEVAPRLAMTNETASRAISSYLATEEGRAQLANAMVRPIRQRMNYMRLADEIARVTPVVPLPASAMGDGPYTDDQLMAIEGGSDYQTDQAIDTLAMQEGLDAAVAPDPYQGGDVSGHYPSPRGRVLADSAAAEFRRALNSQSLSRSVLRVEQLPSGALPAYDVGGQEGEGDEGLGELGQFLPVLTPEQRTDRLALLAHFTDGTWLTSTTRSGTRAMVLDESFEPRVVLAVDEAGVKFLIGLHGVVEWEVERPFVRRSAHEYVLDD